MRESRPPDNLMTKDFAMPRVERVFSLLLLGLLLVVFLPRAAMAEERRETPNGRLWVYVGTYTTTPAAGINFFEFDPATGGMTKPKVVAKTPNPTFLALHPQRPLLYAASEVSKFREQQSGFVGAYAIRAKSGELELLNQQASGGPGPCHVSVDRSGRVVLAANYVGGSVASLPIRPDGGLDAAVSVHRHHGSSVHPTRQTGPFAHSIERRSYEPLRPLGQPGDRQDPHLQAQHGGRSTRAY